MTPRKAPTKPMAVKIIPIFFVICEPYSLMYAPILLPLYAILVVALIFVIGMIVDYVRLAFIEKPVMKATTPSLDRIQSRVK